jgi:dihydroorotase
MSNSIVFQNVRIVDPSRNLDEIGTIIVENGVIVAAGKASAEPGHS